MFPYYLLPFLARALAQSSGTITISATPPSDGDSHSGCIIVAQVASLNGPETLTSMTPICPNTAAIPGTNGSLTFSWPLTSSGDGSASSLAIYGQVSSVSGTTPAKAQAGCVMSLSQMQAMYLLGRTLQWGKTDPNELYDDTAGGVLLDPTTYQAILCGSDATLLAVGLLLPDPYALGSDDGSWTTSITLGNSTASTTSALTTSTDSAVLPSTTTSDVANSTSAFFPSGPSLLPLDPSTVSPPPPPSSSSASSSSWSTNTSFLTAESTQSAATPTSSLSTSAVVLSDSTSTLATLSPSASDTSLSGSSVSATDSDATSSMVAGVAPENDTTPTVSSTTSSVLSSNATGIDSGTEIDSDGSAATGNDFPSEAPTPSGQFPSPSPTVSSSGLNSTTEDSPSTSSSTLPSVMVKAPVSTTTPNFQNNSSSPQPASVSRTSDNSTTSESPSQSDSSLLKGNNSSVGLTDKLASSGSAATAKNQTSSSTIAHSPSPTSSTSGSDSASSVAPAITETISESPSSLQPDPPESASKISHLSAVAANQTSSSSVSEVRSAETESVTLHRSTTQDGNSSSQSVVPSSLATSSTSSGQIHQSSEPAVVFTDRQGSTIGQFEATTISDTPSPTAFSGSESGVNLVGLLLNRTDNATHSSPAKGPHVSGITNGADGGKARVATDGRPSKWAHRHGASVQFTHQVSPTKTHSSRPSAAGGTAELLSDPSKSSTEGKTDLKSCKRDKVRLSFED